MTIETSEIQSGNETTVENEPKDTTEKLSRRERARLKREARENTESDESQESDSVVDGIDNRTKTIPEPSIRDRIFKSESTGKSDTRKVEDKPRKKFDAKKRKREATELAPFLDNALSMYAAMAHSVPVDATKLNVPYWYENNDGNLTWVKGTPGQAVAFHALGSVNATVTKLDEWMDKHRDIIGLLIAGGFVVFFDLHCRGVAQALRQATQAPSERQQEPSPKPSSEPSVTRVVFTDDGQVHTEEFK